MTMFYRTTRKIQCTRKRRSPWRTSLLRWTFFLLIFLTFFIAKNWKNLIHKVKNLFVHYVIENMPLRFLNITKKYVKKKTSIHTAVTAHPNTSTRLHRLHDHMTTPIKLFAARMNPNPHGHKSLTIFKLIVMNSYLKVCQVLLALKWPCELIKTK